MSKKRDEDPIRRRELEDLGYIADVEHLGGGRVRVEMPLHGLDKLIKAARRYGRLTDETRVLA